MNHQPPNNHDADLARLLRSADSEHQVDRHQLDAAALLDAARQRRARSRRMRVASASLGVALVFIAITRPQSRTPAPIAAAKPANDVAAAELRQTLAALEREAQQRRNIVQALRHAERLAAREAELRDLVAHAPSVAADESSRSAAISLQYAVLVEREANDAQQARREYQRVARRFHGTPWAEIAAASLERLSANDTSEL